MKNKNLNEKVMSSMTSSISIDDFDKKEDKINDETLESINKFFSNLTSNNKMESFKMYDIKLTYSSEFFEELNLLEYLSLWSMFLKNNTEINIQVLTQEIKKNNIILSWKITYYNEFYTYVELDIESILVIKENKIIYQVDTIDIDVWYNQVKGSYLYLGFTMSKKRLLNKISKRLDRYVKK